jgi:hypothetical protein
MDTERLLWKIVERVPLEQPLPWDSVGQSCITAALFLAQQFNRVDRSTWTGRSVVFELLYFRTWIGYGSAQGEGTNTGVPVVS